MDTIEPGLPADFDRDAYARRTDHRQHTPGAPPPPAWPHYGGLPHRLLKKIGNRLPYCGKMDMAWTVMLYQQGLIPLPTAKKLFAILPDTQQEEGWGGEDWLKQKLDGDEDTASAVNYGRTLQEPMYRMMLRDGLLEVFDEACATLETLLDQAAVYAEAMMAGQSHFSHAQPTTYGAYLLAVHDGLARGLEQLELAYRRTNENSGGCGACSGTGWPVDRDLITDLLGFDQTVEVAYDCEGSQDEIPQIMFALSSLALTISRTGMDHSIWTLEEINQVHPAPEWQGVSSFMPQKAHGGMFENVRIAANEVLGEMMKVTTTFKGESIQDQLPVYKSPVYVFRGMGHACQALGWLRCLIATLQVNRERMLEIVKNGYSGAPDLAIFLIREKGYGGRRAHRICCNAVRLARERKIEPWAMTGALLDEAARVTSEPEPGLTDEQVQECMGLDQFFEKHCGSGDPHPDETRRLVTLRRKRLETRRAEQRQRRQQLADADQRLWAAIEAIVKNE
ncbi:MAG: hypothetical protein K9N49_07275 [Candidatus Marinimicrobia bacterium]|nr:hypothetical protein [Candidatus Neomarinimicrobiota bacterium]